ncbi:MAG: TonB-dependent receptor [Prevotella sp.]|nr:TonB-dependent receptor [Candidatus Prevotella equi]
MRCLVLLAFLSVTTSLFAQSTRKVSGNVTDESGEPLIGVTVMISGTSRGAVTDMDGHFSLEAPEDAKLEFSYVGYTKQVLPASNTMTITMESDQKVLNELVVIGYGTQKKTDLTGAVSTISAKDFNQGVISSPEQLINGKVAGVQIVNSGGSASAGFTIRVRGGASLNASNDPLIVIDGVPMENGGGAMSLINPSDIETMTVLKDASSTAIYGSRASNGVVIITTKKGKGGDKRPKFSFSTTNSIQNIASSMDMLTGDEMREVVGKMSQGTSKRAQYRAAAGILDPTDADYAETLSAFNSLYGNGADYGSGTPWNDRIYRTAVGTDNHFSMTGSIGNFMPYRVSLGYIHQAGILDTDWSQLATASINLAPSFFDNHLKLNINAKGSTNDVRYANTDAIWGGLTRDVNAPVHSKDGSFGGFFETVNAKGTPQEGALANPVALLRNTSNMKNAKRFVGNIDIDYTLHCLPELRLHATGGYDYGTDHGSYYVPATAYQEYDSGGTSKAWGNNKSINKLLTAYVNYHKELSGKLPMTIDFTAGYDYQHWRYDSKVAYSYDATGAVLKGTEAATDNRHTLLSYYGRLNYTLLERYMLTATIRRDGSSRFADGKQWGTFPSVALAYNIAREKFFEPLSNAINDLKIRASYGVTGQQEVNSNYGFISTYTMSQPGAYYQLGNKYYYTLRPSKYNSNLTWETTKAFNVGVDLGFLNNRFTASIDYYTRKTDDLLATVPIPAGTNFDKQMETNVGNIKSQGVEVSLNCNIISKNDWQWSVTGNATWQRVRITNLRTSAEAENINTEVGFVEGSPVQVLTEGYAPYAFYVYKQVYDVESGKPIEGLYADLNGDGKITSDDRYRYHSPMPDWIFGLSTSLTYKKWTLSTSLRANVGNYLYNKTAMNTGAYETVFYNDYQMNMLNRSYLTTEFNKRQIQSDHYVENASFLKMDNLQLSWNIGPISRYVSMNASFNVQNVFTITKYTGIDPEINGGIDGNIYPRPRTYSLTLGLQF